MVTKIIHDAERIADIDNSQDPTTTTKQAIEETIYIEKAAIHEAIKIGNDIEKLHSVWGTLTQDKEVIL